MTDEPVKFQRLSNEELEARLESLVKKERALLGEILIIIKEIHSRRLYLKRGFSSIYDYLVNGVGYSEGQAQRRIDAAKLANDCPHLIEKIQSGEISLNQVSAIQKAVRQVEKNEQECVSSEEKNELLESLVNKSHSETQIAVAKFFDIPVIQDTKQKSQADGSVRIEITLTKEQFEKFNRAKEFLSHSVPSGDFVDVIEYLAEKVIQKNTQTTSSRSTATVAAKTITPSTRKELLAKNNSCQFIDPKTKRRCESKWQLQVDHIHPRWAGGTNDKGNLQILCGRHNRLKYQEEARIRKLP